MKAAFAVDLDHYFNTDSIIVKPVRSDYNSDEAYAVDSAVYGIPRICRVHGGAPTGSPILFINTHKVVTHFFA